FLISSSYSDRMSTVGYAVLPGIIWLASTVLTLESLSAADAKFLENACFTESISSCTSRSYFFWSIYRMAYAPEQKPIVKATAYFNVFMILSPLRLQMGHSSSI